MYEKEEKITLGAEEQHSVLKGPARLLEAVKQNRK